MAIVDLIMPKLGESIMEATVLKWHKQPGDTVKMDETVLEIATDKVDSEVPSTAEGVIEEILFKVNDVVPIGTVIARIRSGAAASSTPTPAPVTETATNTPPPVQQAQVVEIVQNITPNLQPQTSNIQPSVGNRFYSPLVLNIAASEGVSMSELEYIPGTGNEGRVTKKDILQYVQEKKNGKVTSSEQRVTSLNEVTTFKESPTPTTNSQQLTTYSGNVEIIEMDRMRKLIADHMVRSKQTSPHVTSFTEADVTNLVQWREKVKKEFEKREGTKITFTPIFIE